MISWVNLFFYVILGFCFGFFGCSDIGSINLVVLYSVIGLGVFNFVLVLGIYVVLCLGWKLWS